MRRLAALAVLLVLTVPLAEAQAPSSAKADKKLKAVLEKAGARPGGILRVQRFPRPATKGWTISEDREESEVVLTAPGDGWFYFLDRKAGPRYEHAVAYVFVNRKGTEVKTLDAAWWPVIRDGEGEVVHPESKPPAEDEERWWTAKAHRFLGDAGPSIQDGQNAVKFDWMFAPLPEGASGLVLFSCPATLPEGGAVAAGEGDGEPLRRAGQASFVFFVDFHKGKAFPHEARIVVWGRESQEAQVLEVDQPPRLLGAEGEEIETDDGGRALGAWWADDAHSFLARMRFGGR